MKTRIFLSLLISLLTLSANAYDFMVDGIAYNKNSDDKSVTVTYTVHGFNSNYNGGSGNLYIPENVTYEGKTYSVTSIGSYAFFGCDGFTGSLTIPNSVTSIGEYAFFGCYSFTGSLTIPNSVTSIGDHAFNTCIGFTGSLIIPNSVTSIGNYVFFQCSGFTGTLTIPKSVTSIGNEAFNSCNGLTGTLNIPNSVTSIGVAAFYGCSGFTGSLNIPNSVTYIHQSTFQCTGFSSVTIPNSVTAIGDYAFSGCTLLNEVNVKCENPPTASINTFSQDSYSNATLLVPKGKSDIYSSTDCWREFTNIKEEGGGAFEGIEGDLNGDGVVDIVDVNRIIDIILGINNVKTN